MNTEFIAIAVLMGVVSALVIGVPLWRYRRNQAGTLAAVALLLLMPLAVLSLYTQVSTYPWNNPEIINAPAQGSAGEALEMVAELAARMAEEPTVEGLTMLGRSYVVLERYEEAVTVWHQAWEMTEGADVNVAMSYAEALIFADRESLLTSAGDLIEDVLQKAPFEPRALWYGGLAALARGDTQTGQARWAQLLNNPNLPDNLREVVQAQLAALPAGDTAPQARVPAVPLNIALAVAPELAEEAAQIPTLFLFARRAGQSGGAPLAVKRIADARLPVILQLSDNDAMIAGQSLADAGEIEITARLSQSGRVDITPGDLYGSVTTTWTGVAQDLTLTIDQRIAD